MCSEELLVKIGAKVTRHPKYVPFQLAEVAVTPPAPQSRTVFVTRTGEKYHSSSCIHLSSSKIPISIEEAVGSYSACTVCRP